MINTNNSFDTEQGLPPPYSVNDINNCNSIITVDYDNNIPNISISNNNNFSEITEEIILNVLILSNKIKILTIMYFIVSIIYFYFIYPIFIICSCLAFFGFFGTSKFNKLYLCIFNFYIITNSIISIYIYIRHYNIIVTICSLIMLPIFIPLFIMVFKLLNILRNYDNDQIQHLLTKSQY